jgi:HD-GYP domain-containing protein (c-di-GMP phosphodiesterase class II)
MATAVSDINTVVESMKLGAYDYLTKPFNLTEVGMSAHRALEKRQLEITLNDYHEHLQQKVDEQSKIIRNAFLNAITSLAFALDAKDSYTNGHSVRVSDISVKVAKELGLPDDHVEKIRIAGLIHDIGKIGIPEMLLNKTDKLSEEEFRRIQAHSAIGEHILQPVVDDFEVLSMVRHHHERFDGRGYPDGLSRNQIPIGARILTVVDSYDAMTSDRPYRKSIPLELVAKEIERNRGTQFDPLVVDAFVKITTAMPLL